MLINGVTGVASLAGIGGTAVASFTPISVALPLTSVGSTSSSTFEIANTGPVPLVVSDISIDFTDGVKLQPNGCAPPVKIGPGLHCTVTVVFSPTRGGVHNRAITVTTNAPGSPQTLWVSGQAIGAPAVSFEPASVDFGTLPRGTVSAPVEVVVRNTGTDSLRIIGAQLGGANAADIVVEGGTCLPTAGHPDVLVEITSTCTLVIVMRPGGVGLRMGSIEMLTPDGPLGALPVQVNVR